MASDPFSLQFSVASNSNQSAHSPPYIPSCWQGFLLSDLISRSHLNSIARGALLSIYTSDTRLASKSRPASLPSSPPYRLEAAGRQALLSFLTYWRISGTRRRHANRPLPLPLSFTASLSLSGHHFTVFPLAWPHHRPVHNQHPNRAYSRTCCCSIQFLGLPCTSFCQSKKYRALSYQVI